MGKRHILCLLMALLLVVLFKTDGLGSTHVQAEARDRSDKSYEDMERQLKSLMEDVRRLEKEAAEKIRRELIPLLRKEIERLRKWLRDLHLDGDEEEPVKVSQGPSSRICRHSRSWSSSPPWAMSLVPCTVYAPSIWPS